MLIVTNGIGNFLLPHYARRHRAAAGDVSPLLGPAAGLVAAVLAYTALATALAPQLSTLITGEEGSLERVAVAGWGVFAAAFALGIPAGTLVLARGRSSVVFRLRAIDSTVGLTIAVALVGIAASLAPYGLAVGALLGAALLWGRARAAPSPAVPA
jgi:hypothetical protein